MTQQRPRPWLIRLMNFYPPYLGAGIRLTRISADRLEIDVELRQRWWNRNYVGTAFGGSLYSMVDPFFMLILMEALGTEYVVWDKSATIHFRKPGRGTVYASFRISPEEIQRVREAVEREGKINPVYRVEIRDGAGELIAEAEKTLSVRKKTDEPRRLPGSPAPS